MFIMFKRDREDKPCNRVTWKPFHKKHRQERRKENETQYYNKQNNTEIQGYTPFTLSWALNNNELWFPVHLELCLNQGSQMC